MSESAYTILKCMYKYFTCAKTSNIITRKVNNICIPTFLFFFSLSIGNSLSAGIDTLFGQVGSFRNSLRKIFAEIKKIINEKSHPRKE